MKDRITIKRAKELAKEKNSRLPRCGYEVLVESGVTSEGQEFKTYLQNISGTFKVWTWYEVMPLSWYEARNIPIRSSNLGRGN